MDKSEVYLEKFKQLEDVVRSTYNIKESDSITYYLTGQTKYKSFADEIRYCQKVRNLLAHEVKVNGSFAVDASDEMIRFIENLTNSILNQPRCFDIQIKLKDVCRCSLSDSVKEAIAIMREKMFTHIPILDENEKVIGVFDENSVFTYIANEEIVSIDDSLTFKDIQDYISIENREMESFVFVKPTTYVEELEEMIEDAFDKGLRVGLAFVTLNGTSSDKLQGIITPWDIINSSAEYH